MDHTGIDRDMLAVLKALASLEPHAIETVDAVMARRSATTADAVNLVLEQQGRSLRPEDILPDVASHDTTVAGAVGPLPARVFKPAGVGPFPVVVYFHGGGWALADRQVYDASARGLAHGARALVVSVDYRRAPEHRFPAAWDDALASYQWTLQNVGRLGGDPDRVALAGENAGASLALATAIAARDLGLRMPRHVLAVYPVAQTRLNTPSYLENGIRLPLNRAMMKWFLDQLTPSGDERDDPRLQLLNAPLEGLPPVTLISAHIDPLRNDSQMLAAALRAAGVAMEHREFQGVTHEFFGTAAVVAKAREAQAFAGRRLREAFSAQ
jgi:acetyl esterase